MKRETTSEFNEQKQMQLAAAIAYHIRRYSPPTYIQKTTEAEEIFKKNRANAITNRFNKDYVGFCNKDYQEADSQARVGTVCTTLLGTATAALSAGIVLMDTTPDTKIFLGGLALIGLLGAVGFGTQTTQHIQYARIIKPLPHQGNERQ